MPKTLDRHTAPRQARRIPAVKPTIIKSGKTIEQTATELGPLSKFGKPQPGVFTLRSPRSGKTYRLTVRFATDGTLIISCSCPASGDCWHGLELKRRHARKQVVRPYPDQCKGMCPKCGDVTTHQTYQAGGSTMGRFITIVECWSHTSGSGANGVGTEPCDYREVLH